MSEIDPATKADVTQARDAIIQRLEGLRQQNSAEHSMLERFMRAVHTNFSIFMERFGFLKPKPPAPPKDDTQ